ncbi:MAG: hypothetical protein KC442_19990 [Thermomicrobiales bacterium]|nr:hypothetical protein [Thermomicrobiales bacterium]
MRVSCPGRGLLLAALLAFGMATPALAQEQLPEGVTLDVFASGVAADVPQSADQILLVELTMQPGAVLPLEPDDQIVSLVAIREGELEGKLDAPVQINRAGAAPEAAEQATAGTLFTLAAGDSALIPAGAVGEVRPGDAVMSALVFLAAPATSDDGNANVMPQGVTFTPLAAGETPDLGTSGGYIWLGEFKLEPGAMFPGQAQPGAELGAGTAGEFTVKTTGGPGFVVLRDFTRSVLAGESPQVTEETSDDTVTFGADDAVFFPDGNTVDISNEGSTEAVTLFGGIGPLPTE